MKWLTFKVQQEPGFRLNLTDILFIALLCAMSLGLRVAMPDLSLYALPLYIGFTFFLFCNVFRIGNHAEAWWYIPFGIAAITTVYTLQLETFWWSVLLIFEPLKVVLIVRAMKSKTYHGVFHGHFQSQSSPSKMQ